MSGIGIGNLKEVLYDYRTEVLSATVAAGQVRFIASGDELAYLNLTVNGTYRVNGSLYCNNLTVGAGGVVTIGPGGEIITGTFA